MKKKFVWLCRIAFNRMDCRMNFYSTLITPINDLTTARLVYYNNAAESAVVVRSCPMGETKRSRVL